MIMTKDKARELSKMASSRLAVGTEVLPDEGTYTLATSQDAEDIRRLADDHEVDYLIMGMVVPAHKAATFCQLLRDETGMLPSSMLLLKKDAPPSAGLRIPATSRIPTSEKSSHDASANIFIKGIDIIPGRHEVKVNGKLVVLTFSEFKILQTLAAKPGWVFSREQLIHAVHGDNYNCTERAVDVQVTGLRKKLGAAGSNVETVRGVGYRFAE